MSTLPEKPIHVKGMTINPDKIFAPAKTTRKMTKTRMRLFLEALAETGIIAHAAKKVNVDTSTINRYRHKYPEFDAAIEEIKADTIDLMEAEAIRRGVHGWEEDVFFQGEKTGHTIRRYSDKMLEMVLRANVDKYANKSSVEVSGPNGGPVQISETKSKLLQLLQVDSSEVEEGEFTDD
jgi:hypothetical protein